MEGKWPSTLLTGDCVNHVVNRLSLRQVKQDKPKGEKEKKQDEVWNDIGEIDDRRQGRKMSRENKAATREKGF